MLIIGLVVVSVWIAILAVVVALCQISARADNLTGVPRASAPADPRPAREAAPTRAPASARRVGQPAGSMSRFRLVH
jgi:hypothetical protein